MMPTRSTRATRLSQRILVSTAANEGLDLESWDISGTFLKGLTFERVRQIKGITTPVRKGAIIAPAPANVFRHLAEFDSKFKIDYDRLGDYVLLCVNPVYGLNDAPLAWQPCLHMHLEEHGGIPSLLNKNLFYCRAFDTDRITSIVTTHVDDVGSAGNKKWLDEMYKLLEQKFGKVIRQTMPFMHCGRWPTAST